MSAKREDDPDEIVEQAKAEILYGTGHGRPPKNAGFRKGQSGNPAGRPKRSSSPTISDRSANALALREAERQIAVREGTAVQQLPAIVAVLRAQYASAARGNAYAQKHIIERYDCAEREQRRYRAEEIELWTNYVRVRRQAIAQAADEGRPLPTQLPHPDDIIVDDESGVRIVGPLDETEERNLNESLKIRDTLFLQEIFDRRISSRSTSEPGTALVFAEFINRTVPQRFRLSDTALLLRIARAEAMTKRELMKRLYRDWRSLGARPRRGVTFPPLKYIEELLELLDHANT